MVSDNFSNQRKFLFPKSILGFILTGVLFGFLLNGCANKKIVYTSILGSKAITSIQKLEDRSIGVLHDKLTITDDDADNNVRPEFHIFNRTVHSLTVNLSGTSGAYTFVLEPKRDQIWLVNSGNYHVEISVPGFPTTATDELRIESDKIYKWELWKTKH